jgi:hypothetical protein
MRITVPHNKTKAEAIKAVEDGANRALTAALPGPLRISNVQKAWTGDQLDFSLNASLMSASAPIKGSILVTDRDITIDADIPALLSMLIPEKKIEEAAARGIKGLLT